MIANLEREKVALAVKPLKKPRAAAGTVSSTDLKPITAKDAEFLVYSNSYVRRGVRKTANAVMRNGYSITPELSGDKELIEQLAAASNLTLLIRKMVVDTCIYGKSFVEMAVDKNLGNIIKLLPPSEIDYIRDESNQIIYKDGHPKGYVQKRNNENVAEWSYDQIAELRFIEIGGVDIGISMLQPLVQPCTEYGLTRANLADGFIRSLNVVHVKATGATQEELDDISVDMSRQFTAETAYVTSDRIAMDVINANSSPVHPSEYMEPTIGEIAAAFDMPIELIAPTINFKLADFDKRNAEWLETIKDLQTDIASLFEQRIFPAFTENPIKMEFNSPMTISISELVTAIGFAVQSNAMTAEVAQKIINEHPAFKILQI